MCAPGMAAVDEELTAVFHRHQNPTTNVSLDAVVAGTTSSRASSLVGGGFREHSFASPAERSAMRGPGGSLPYSDSSPTKPTNMSIQTLNPFQEPGGQSFASSSPMHPKNGIRRQGLWSGSPRPFANGRNGELEMDPRQQVPEYPPALLDQNPGDMPDPYRVSGGLARYHSAPSSFLANLADLHQDSALSSFFSDADLPPLNATSDSSMENMDTEQSSTSMFDDKYLLDTRKFERIGTSQLGTVSGGLVSQKSLQSVYKHSMEVLHENPSPPSQTPSSSQMSSTAQMPSTLGMSSSLGVPSSMCLPQQGNNIQSGQQISLGNLAGSVNFSCGVGSDYGVGSSGAVGGHPNGNRSNSLVRQSSSPAGLLAQLSIDVQPQLTNNEKRSPSTPLAHSPEDSLSGGTSEENVGTPGMMSSMDVGAWEDNSYVNNIWGNDTFSARKRYRDKMDLGDVIAISEPSDKNSLEHGPAPGSLTRHMSLPALKSKNNVLPEDILQSVPCRIRAKRGCATHPRSIAERVRRTRISERMRKLQELVPNMDKQQTNTADMLDEAVEYVKQLQRQVQELTESQAKCSCCRQDHKNNVS